MDRKEQGEWLLETAVEYETSNDMTFLVNVWLELLQVRGANRSIESAREKDHLKDNWKGGFKRRSVPPPVVRDPALQSFADHAPRMKNPSRPLPDRYRVLRILPSYSCLRRKNVCPLGRRGLF